MANLLDKILSLLGIDCDCQSPIKMKCIHYPVMITSSNAYDQIKQALITGVNIVVTLDDLIVHHGEKVYVAIVPLQSVSPSFASRFNQNGTLDVWFGLREDEIVCEATIDDGGGTPFTYAEVIGTNVIDNIIYIVPAPARVKSNWSVFTQMPIACTNYVAMNNQQPDVELHWLTNSLWLIKTQTCHCDTYGVNNIMKFKEPISK